MVELPRFARVREGEAQRDVRVVPAAPDALDGLRRRFPGERRFRDPPAQDRQVPGPIAVTRRARRSSSESPSAAAPERGGPAAAPCVPERVCGRPSLIAALPLTLDASASSQIARATSVLGLLRTVPLKEYSGELAVFDHPLPQATFRLVTEVVPVRLLAPLRAVAPRACRTAYWEHGLVGPADDAADVMSERFLHEGVALLVLALDLEAAAVLEPPHAELAIRSRAVDAVDAVALVGRRARLFFLGMA